MNFRNLDLNLLLVLDGLLKYRNATVVARELGVSQPTVSASLRKLRVVFDDPLFVKCVNGMEPTPRALDMQEHLTQIIGIVGTQLLMRQSFDPLTTDRRFTLLTGDVGQIVFVRRILPALRRAAPHASIKVVGCAASERRTFLEEGRVDLALGHFPNFHDTPFYQQRLYADPMVCVVRAGHPALVNGAISLTRFAAMEHAVIGTEGEYQHLYESCLRQHGIDRRVVIELANISAAPIVLAESDLIAVMPSVPAQIFCKDGTLCCVPSPIDIPTCEVKQYWTGKLHQDPSLVWLRRIIAAQCQEQAQPEVASTTADAQPY